MAGHQGAGIEYGPPPGLALIVVVVAGPTVWPWYLMWGVVLLAATTGQRSVALAVVAGVGMLIVGPSGAPVLVGEAYLAVLVACALTGWWLVARRPVPTRLMGAVGSSG